MGRGHRLVPVVIIKERVTKETRLKDLVDYEVCRRRMAGVKGEAAMLKRSQGELRGKRRHL